MKNTTELYNFLSMLNPNKPVTDNGNIPAWVARCLEPCGWSLGQALPSGLSDYLAAVVNFMEYPATMKDQHKIKEAMKLPEVQDTLTRAIKKANDVLNAEQIAKERTVEMMGEAAATNPVLSDLYNKTLEAERKKIEEESFDEVHTESIIPDDIESDAEDSLSNSNGSRPEVLYPIECPRCHQSLQEEYNPTKFSEEDVTNYLCYVMGGKRFRRKYELWNGMVTVVYQTLTPEEEALVRNELSAELQAGIAAVDPKAVYTYRLYFSSLSIAALQYAPSLGLANPVVPSVFADQFTPKDGKSRLRRFIDEWFHKVIASTELEDAVLHHWRVFNSVRNDLQQRLSDPDFWKGVAVVK